ncbi:uncharacterized protein CCR75_003329 [Bremia lactucae]|uniref:Transcription factor TFIIIC triple barrel domain-containing protein n=1 Tax=Bremia lactucae TaxID=4779 RepID=A0A976ILI6_BRELC|nr:hypothetical protein CCR75_003325 [Bremia lactucae]TDH73987.1 hypothetical protein CCR75_003329 [Bremia lactucae]
MNGTSLETAMETGLKLTENENLVEEMETEIETECLKSTTCTQQVNSPGDVDELENEASAVDSEENNNHESSDEEILVVLELCDFTNHPLFDDYSTATLEGIDTATPLLKIGEYELYGQLEETVGTNYFYDTDTSRVSDKKYQFAGQTIRKIKFTIAPPEDV